MRFLNSFIPPFIRLLIDQPLKSNPNGFLGGGGGAGRGGIQIPTTCIAFNKLPPHRQNQQSNSNPTIRKTELQIQN